MNAPQTKRFLLAFLTCSLAAIVAFGAARSARAADDDGDPFAGDQPKSAAPAAVPSTSSVAPAPASSPETSANAIAPGIVEQLPASAYPEPYTRGLYGGPLWLDLQGLQWPYTPRTGVGISGYGWLDNTYKYTRIGDPSQSPHTTVLFQQGRFLLRVTPTYTNGIWFVQAQGEIVALKDQYVADATTSQEISADDVWVRTGHWQLWDVTVGRFQAFDVYPLGMGLDLNTDERIGAYDRLNSPTPLYAADFMLYRPAGPGNVALHLYPTRYLRLELLGQYGNVVGGENVIGGRPAGIFDIGWLKIRGALEYQYKFAQDPAPGSKDTVRNRGGALSAQLVFAPYVEAGGNFGYAVIDEADTNNGDAGNEDPQTSGNKISFGGFIDAVPFPGILPNLMVGGGGNYTKFHNLYTPSGETSYEHFSNLQTYLAVQYLFYRQLFFKVVGGYAKSHFENIASGVFDDDQFSIRVRVMYLF
jgi:hypothetical protein